MTRAYDKAPRLAPIGTPLYTAGGSLAPRRPGGADLARGSHRRIVGGRARSAVDRLQQLGLLEALQATDGSLRRDECGDWQIGGRIGHIYCWGDAARNAWWLGLSCRSVRAWSAAKKRLSWCKCTQDGDAEGAFHMIGLPTTPQVVVIRQQLGIRKRRSVSETERERLVERTRSFRFRPDINGGSGVRHATDAAAGTRSQPGSLTRSSTRSSALGSCTDAPTAGFDA